MEAINSTRSVTVTYRTLPGTRDGVLSAWFTGYGSVGLHRCVAYRQNKAKKVGLKGQVPSLKLVITKDNVTQYFQITDLTME